MQLALAPMTISAGRFLEAPCVNSCPGCIRCRQAMALEDMASVEHSDEDFLPLHAARTEPFVELEALAELNDLTGQCWSFDAVCPSTLLKHLPVLRP